MKKSTKEKSTLALVFGILSLVFWLFPIMGLPFSLVGLILGIQDIEKKKPFAKGALICSIIGLCLSIANAAIGAYMGATGQLNLF